MESVKRVRIEPEVKFTKEEDERFMGIALLAAKSSKDPVKKVGACIVNENKQVVGIGFNAFPRGLENHSWDDKKKYVVHAEVNAVINKLCNDLKNCSLYVTFFPCNECAKIVIQSQINRIIYLEDADGTKEKYIASKDMLRKVEENVLCEKFEPVQEEIILNFKVKNLK